MVFNFLRPSFCCEGQASLEVISVLKLPINVSFIYPRGLVGSLKYLTEVVIYAILE